MRINGILYGKLTELPIRHSNRQLSGSDDPRFLKTGFQFRFTNYASLSPNQNDPSMVGNCDHWNIDYVLLDKNRNAGDTIFADVAFTLPLRSVLKNHEAMPWKQYREIELQEMGSSIPIHYRNNDTIIRNVTRNFEIMGCLRQFCFLSLLCRSTNIRSAYKCGL